ncbi:MAG: AI-2E family transporter [Bacteroidales bacterium]|nr:AI-2E family transporter [Bacteroidales bacterium]
MNHIPQTTGSKFPAAVTVAAFIIILAGLMYAASFITPVLIALFISIICAEPITWLQKHKVPQGIALTIVFIFVVLVFFLFGGIIGNSLSSFSENLPKYEENLNGIGESLLMFLQGMGIDFSVDQLSGAFEPAKVMSITGGILGQLSLLMGNALTIVFLALFLLMELDSITEKVDAIYKDSIGSVNYLDTIGKSIRHYLSIKTTTSLMTGVLVWIGLAILGLDYAIIWALLAFLLNYIPNFGSIIAAIPAVLFAMIQLGFGGTLWTIGIFVVVNMIIGYAVEPKMMGKGMGLSTFVVFLSLIFWGYILGTTGMFLSVPLTMTIKIMLEQHPDTAWIAVLLGTKQDARALMEKKKDE